MVILNIVIKWFYFIHDTVSAFNNLKGQILFLGIHTQNHKNGGLTRFSLQLLKCNMLLKVELASPYEYMLQVPCVSRNGLC